MTTKHEKTPAGAANTNEGNNETSKHSNTDHATPLAHLIRPGKSNGNVHFAFHGDTLNRDSAVPVYLDDHDALRSAYQLGELKICHDCVQVRDNEIFERIRRVKAEQAAREERERREQEIVTSIVGKDIHPLDVRVELLNAYRNGDEVTVYLEALKALDDYQLELAGSDSRESEEG